MKISSRKFLSTAVLFLFGCCFDIYCKTESEEKDSKKKSEHAIVVPAEPIQPAVPIANTAHPEANVMHAQQAQPYVAHESPEHFASGSIAKPVTQPMYVQPAVVNITQPTPPAPGPTQNIIVRRPVVYQAPAGQPVSVPVAQQPVAQPTAVPVPVPAISRPAPIPLPVVAPQVHAPVPAPVQKPREEKIPPIDTLKDEEGGNWLLKRVWYEQAESKFEEIINKNDQIIEPQMNFFNKRNESSKNLGVIFRKIGYAQGELEEMLSFFLNNILQERKVEGGLSLEERQFIDLTKEKKRELEQLKLDLASLADLDTSIDDVLVQVVAQVNKCREYEKRAWKDFKEIGIILNDKKAKVYFYQIESDLKNIQNIFNYLVGDLKNYFDGLLDKTQKLAESVASQVDKLKSAGINVKESFEKIKKAEEIRAIKAIEDKKHPPVKKVEKGWGDTIAGWFDPVVDTFTSFWGWILSFFK